MFHKVTELLPEQACLPGRKGRMIVSGKHLALGTYYVEPFPSNTRSILFGMGCFWGAERLFWNMSGVYSTAAGYAGGVTSNPSYEEVCSGYTNHAEMVLVVYQPEEISLQKLLSVFWQEHDPTQGMRQGNDIGTQYRSAIYPNSQEDIDIALETQSEYQTLLTEAGKGKITTEIRLDLQFYYAEEGHQQYLYKNPNGYCGLAGCGVSF